MVGLETRLLDKSREVPTVTPHQALSTPFSLPRIFQRLFEQRAPGSFDLTNHGVELQVFTKDDDRGVTGIGESDKWKRFWVARRVDVRLLAFLTRLNVLPLPAAYRGVAARAPTLCAAPEWRVLDTSGLITSTLCLFVSNILAVR